MKKISTTNLTLKIISVVLAFIIWLIVVNVSNPEVTRTKSVTVEIINDNIITSAAKTYDIIGSNTVTISYDVRSLDENKIRASDFRAYADLSQLYDITSSVPIVVEVVNNKDLIIGTPVARPNVIRIETEDIQKKTFDLTTAAIGTPDKDVSVGSIGVEPTSVTVTGPMSLIGQITSVGVEIDVGGAKSNMHGYAEPVFYDANGNRLDIKDDRLSVNPSTVEYNITMLMGKSLEIKYNVSGTPGDGYQYTGAECSIKSVAVRGLDSILDSITEINVPDTVLNIDGATGDKEVSINLAEYLPSGVEAISETKVTVKLKIEALDEKTIILTKDDLIELGHSYGKRYTISPERISVVLKGLDEKLGMLSAKDIKATIDYTHMSDGTHSGTLTFELPDGISVASYTPFDIIVEEIGAASKSNATTQ